MPDPDFVPDALSHHQRRARRPVASAPLRRSRSQRVLGGLCGGIAAFVDTRPRNVRVLYALSAVLSLGVTAVGYPVLCLLVPLEPRAATTAG